jgi:beta-phosphoglucomutase
VFRAILFDLDGTLIDSEPWHKRSEVEVFRSFGLNVTKADLEPFTGLTLPDLLGRVAAEHGIEIEPDDFIAHSQPILGGYIAQHMEAFPETEEVLRALRIKRALVTSSLPWYVDAVRQRFPWLDATFDERICSADISNGKPHPEPYLTAAARLGEAPEACVVVEDSVNGVRSGLAAGCTVIGVDRAGKGHLSEATHTFKSLTNLMSFLQS